MALVSDLSEEPIGSASIAQVHTATINGRKVAVKVQFPGVAKTVGADVALMRRAFDAVMWIQRKELPMDAVFAEVERVLRQEVDFEREAAFLEQFGALVAKTKLHLLWPKLLKDFSTRRVLSMTFEEGERLSDWIKIPRKLEQKQVFASLILELLILEFFEWGCVQNRSKFRQLSGTRQPLEIVLLDFGATKTYPVALRQQVRELVVAALSNDRQRVTERAIAWKFLDPGRLNPSRIYSAI